MDVAILGDQIDDVILGRHLHCHGEIILRLGWEKDIDLLLLVCLVAGGGCTDLDNVQLFYRLAISTR